MAANVVINVKKDIKQRFLVRVEGNLEEALRRTVLGYCGIELVSSQTCSAPVVDVKSPTLLWNHYAHRMDAGVNADYVN